ncbi:hypothetical protein P4S70_01820 [Enterovibrio sp. Hal110]
MSTKLEQLVTLANEMLAEQRPMPRERAALDITQDLVGMAFVYADELEILVKVSTYAKESAVDINVFPVLRDRWANKDQALFVESWCASFESFETLEHIEALLINFLFDFEANSSIGGQAA